jgi:hypothetical protein
MNNFFKIVSGTIGLSLIIAANHKNQITSEINFLTKNQHLKEFPIKSNSAFKEGEVLTYKLHYGLIDAAEATLEVKPNTTKIGSRECYHIVGNGVSKGTFDYFFKVRDKYESYVDKDALIPWVFSRNCNEGGYLIYQNYFFNHYANKVDVGNGETHLFTENTQDMISAFYAARNMDFTSAKIGDVFALNCFIDKENWPLQIRYIGKETIDSEVGKIRCLKFRPIVQKGRVFKKEEDLTIWISDDKNHIPVRGQAKILIGSVKMDLIGFKNINNPIAKQ